MKRIQLLFAMCILVNITKAQTCFNAGNGSGGAYNATTNTTIAGGSYSFTTFNINAGVTVSVTGIVPLKVFCTGAVTINGTLTANGGDGTSGITFTSAGIGGIGVAGGNNGGNGFFSATAGPVNGTAGFGIGGTNTQGAAWSGGGGAGYALAGSSTGNTTGGFGGAQYGNTSVSNLYPGSGGGGGSGGAQCGSGGGGAGGGVIVFNTSSSFSVGINGLINSNGGNGGSDGSGSCGGGGGGSGGTIWLAAPTITNNGAIKAIGGTGGSSSVPNSPYYGTGGNGANGRIRIDANSAVSGTGIIQPTAGSSYTIPAAPLSANITATNSCGSSTNSGIAAVSASNGISPYTYSWSPVSATTSSVSNLPTGSYTCVVTDAGSCPLTKTITVSSSINPTVSVASSSSLICSGQSATLTASTSTDVTTYSWMPSGNTNSISISPTITTTYSIVVSNSLTGCSATTSISQAVSPCTGILAVNADASGFLIYPNPNNGNFNIELKNATQIQILNSLGQIILSRSLEAGKHSVDLNSQPKGLYFISVKAGDKLIIEKIIKE